MAQAKAAPKKEEAKVGNKPEFTIRAKVTNPQNGKDYWQNIGAIWPVEWAEKDQYGRETGDMVKGWSIKINNQPMGWTGDCLAMPYKEFEQK